MLMWWSHISSAAARITRAKDRFEQLTESISNYEALFEAQRVQLDLAQSNEDYDTCDPSYQLDPDTAIATDLMIEEETVAIRELENKKEELEMKLKSLDRQLASVYRGE
jgi:chaperonin cofactor prefoldin